MGSRSGTGYRNLIGYGNSQICNKQVKKISEYLESEDGKNAVNHGLMLLSMSHPVLNQMYITYKVSRMAYDIYDTYREEEDPKRRMMKVVKGSAPFIIGSLADELIDDVLADFIIKEQLLLNQNQVNLIKMGAKYVLIRYIQRKMEGVV
jgi:hypothetical protein